jgi:1,4-alpha-glucan branching enzyme
MRRLVNACHGRGVAVILDAVYGHCHPDFAYNLVYRATGKPNPMMGRFEEEFDGLIGPDYRKAFARDFFRLVNEHWLSEYHVDGFRYDFVPGSYDGPLGVGYANIVFQTNRFSRRFARFQADGGRSRIIQCAEHLGRAREMLAQTYSNACWQNELLDTAGHMARTGTVPDSIGHRLDPELGGFVATYRNPATGDEQPVAPFQYLESHDHPRFMTQFGQTNVTSLVGEAFGDRSRFYKTQPYAIALLTAKGIPMLWQGQELGENWGLKGFGEGRILFERPVHWEYFYDAYGKALVRLYRILGRIRRQHRALGSRSGFFYVNDPSHARNGVVVYRRSAPAESLVVALNFSDQERWVEIEFPHAGNWTELIDEVQRVHVSAAGDRVWVRVPSNYGVILEHQT